MIKYFLAIFFTGTNEKFFKYYVYARYVWSPLTITVEHSAGKIVVLTFTISDFSSINRRKSLLHIIKNEKTM